MGVESFIIRGPDDRSEARAGPAENERARQGWFVARPCPVQTPAMFCVVRCSTTADASRAVGTGDTP